MMKQQCNQVQYHVFTPLHHQQKLETILIIASIHGSEPAGSLACLRLLPVLFERSQTLNKRIVLIYSANPCGLKLGWRQNPYYVLQGKMEAGDMNRQYEEGGQTQINQQILQLIRRYKPTLIVDLHEAWGYFQLQEGSMGNGIYPVGSFASQLSLQLQRLLNQNIQNPVKQYVVHDWQPVPEGSLRELCKQKRWNYILIETSAEQSLQDRIQQHVDCLRHLIF